MKKIIVLLISLFMCLSLAACAKKVETTTVEGEAEGYGGTITAKVTLEGDKIVGLELTGDKETPAVGGEALKTLQDEIVKAGTYEVDAVAGATWTSNGVFAAIKNALGIGENTGSESDSNTTVSASNATLDLIIVPALPGSCILSSITILFPIKLLLFIFEIPKSLGVLFKSLILFITSFVT